MRILITGVNGFFGKKLAYYFLSKNYLVYGIGRNKKSKIDNIRYWQIDLSLENNIDHIIKKCDVIYHFAAITAHDEIINNTQMAEQITIDGTRLILDSIEKCKDSKLFVYASTGKVYGRYKTLPLTENHKTNPLNALGRIKRNTEKFINSRINKKDKFVILRIFNVYGPGQKDNFLIPTIFNQIKSNLNKKQITILLGNTSHQRDYLFIDDLIKLFFDLIKLKTIKKEISFYNVGSGIPLDVNQILEEIMKILSINIQVKINPLKLRKDEHNIEYCSIQKISSLTGWKPETNIETGLRSYINNDFKELN